MEEGHVEIEALDEGGVEDGSQCLRAFSQN